MFKNERGITLIALVVTIIILLILAGVTLSLTLTGNGLFNKTREAANSYQTESNKESNLVTDIENVIDQYSNKSK